MVNKVKEMFGYGVESVAQPVHREKDEHHDLVANCERIKVWS